MENGDFYLRKRRDRGDLCSLCVCRGGKGKPGSSSALGTRILVLLLDKCAQLGAWGAGREPLSSAAAPGVPGAVSEKGWGLWRAQELPSASSRGVP